ncbi:hypothetical protein VNI00_010606 [Paramarasmius palmivorus]|uniref:Cytochrome P450 n=1 Tax=Paramarasmius palmivorus TaxID=297713 RepID=A0AAW0CIL4_9AGAR
MEHSTLGLVITALVVVWIHQQRRTSKTVNSVLYKIPGPPNPSWITGEVPEVFSTQPWTFLRTMESYGPTAVYSGFFGAKIIHTFDPKAMYHILIKDQGTYDEMPWFLQINKLLLGEGLMATEGERHRRQKKLLNPAFSTSQLREIVPIFNGVARTLRDTLANKVDDGVCEARSTTINMFSWLSRVAFELFSQAGLGTSFDSLQDEASAHPYSRVMKSVVPYIGRVAGAGGVVILPLLEKFGTPESRLALVKILPFRLFQDGLEYAYYMWDLSTDVVREKKERLFKGSRKEEKDVITTLIHANLNAAQEDQLDEKEIIGQQVSTFSFAAMDTTSSALSRTFDMLSRNPTVQEKLRAEILEAQEKHGAEDLAYDVLVNLPYLEAVCKESLRFANRDCILPLATPITATDGSLITEIPISKGQEIYGSLIGSNRNPQFWGPDADEWKPERWLSPLPSSLIEAKIPGIYSHLMTFSAGPRSCIGSKFSQLEMKTVLAFLLGSFKFTPTGVEIIYHSAGVANPTVKGSLEPRLPLRLEKVPRAT